MGDKENKKERCFVIMPISDQGEYSVGHFSKVYDQIFKPAIEKAGYEAYRVDENKISDSIIGKIFAALQECPMAICDLSNRNPNVLYELGIRQAYDKPVVLVQDEKTDRIFDVSGITTVNYSSKRLYEEVLCDREKITEAIISTKEGKQNSIIKVVNVKNAEVQAINMSREDKIEIMLSGLADDVRELKRSRTKEVELDNKTSMKNGWNQMTYNIADEMPYRLFSIEIKQGTTNKKVSDLINRIEKLTGITASWKRRENTLTVQAEDISQEVFTIVRNMVEENLT